MGSLPISEFSGYHCSFRKKKIQQKKKKNLRNNDKIYLEEFNNIWMVEGLHNPDLPEQLL